MATITIDPTTGTPVEVTKQFTFGVTPVASVATLDAAPLTPTTLLSRVNARIAEVDRVVTPATRHLHMLDAACTKSGALTVEATASWRRARSELEANQPLLKRLEQYRSVLEMRMAARLRHCEALLDQVENIDARLLLCSAKNIAGELSETDEVAQHALKGVRDALISEWMTLQA